MLQMVLEQKVATLALFGNRYAKGISRGMILVGIISGMILIKLVVYYN